PIFLPDLERGVETLSRRALGRCGLADLDGRVPQRAGEGRRARLGEVLDLVDLLLDRVEVPHLLSLSLDLLVSLAAGARAEHVPCCESDDESYFAPHEVS